MVACTLTSSADTGSSATRMSGRSASALAIATRCRWPPENWRGYARSASSPSPTRPSSSRLNDATSLLGTTWCTRSSSVSMPPTVSRGFSDE